MDIIRLWMSIKCKNEHILLHIKNSYRGKIDQSTIISLLSWYHLLTPPEQMSTSPIGCISPAHKWIIVNNCATIHATRHTRAHRYNTCVIVTQVSLALLYHDATFFLANDNNYYHTSINLFCLYSGKYVSFIVRSKKEQRMFPQRGWLFNCL